MIKHLNASIHSVMPWLYARLNYCAVDAAIWQVQL